MSDSVHTQLWHRVQAALKARSALLSGHDYQKVAQAQIADGARYIAHVNIDQYQADQEIVINSMILVVRSRMTWARPDVRQAMETGQNGFVKRQIGEWIEDGRFPINGRVASVTHTMYNGQTYTMTYTISEDGNTISYQDTYGNTNTFNRE